MIFKFLSSSSNHEHLKKHHGCLPATFLFVCLITFIFLSALVKWLNLLMYCRSISIHCELEVWLIVPGQGGRDWISPVSVLESLAHWLNLSYVSKQMNNESLALFFPSVLMCAMSHQNPANSVQGQFRTNPWPLLGLTSRNDIIVAYCINLLSRPHNLGNKISKTQMDSFLIKHRSTQAAIGLHQLIDGYKWA